MLSQSLPSRKEMADCLRRHHNAYRGYSPHDRNIRVIMAMLNEFGLRPSVLMEPRYNKGRK